MSKAKQRKISMWNQGRRDAINGVGHVWKRHPNLSDYNLGYKYGLYERKKAEREREYKEKYKNATGLLKKYYKVVNFLNKLLFSRIW